MFARNTVFSVGDTASRNNTLTIECMTSFLISICLTCLRNILLTDLFHVEALFRPNTLTCFSIAIILLFTPTGTIRPVRRSFYDPTSAPAKGWIWEWENDAGSWIVYDVEVSIALQAAHDRQQLSLDLTALGFCYLVDFQTMTQFNMQTQRKRRIQRRSDIVYPFVYGPLPKSSEARAITGRMMRGVSSGGGSTGALLGIGVSGSTLIRKGSVVYPSGTLSVSSLAPLGQPCACKQCVLVMSIKTNATASQTLGRKPHATKANHPKSSFGTLPKNSKSLSVLNSFTNTIPDGLSFSCSPSEKPKNSSDFARSLSHLTSDTAALSMSSSCSSHLPLAPSTKPHALSARNTSSATVVPTAMLVNVSSSTTLSTTSSTTLPQQRSASCAAPLPPRASLAGLSRPALQRIAMAQSQALVASG